MQPPTPYLQIFIEKVEECFSMRPKTPARLIKILKIHCCRYISSRLAKPTAGQFTAKLALPVAKTMYHIHPIPASPIRPGAGGQRGAVPACR